ncbi:MAG: TrkH family potassium uptake protein [Roseinatronobacter sp.]
MPRTRPLSRSLNRRLRQMPPPLSLALLYALLIALGATLLKLPIATTIPITWSDAVFTATSAVTVTGLVVLDTGTDLTGFGQAVVAGLIQLGGLGLMTFAVLILAALGLPVGITGQIYLRDDLNQSTLGRLGQLVRMIGLAVFFCVALGTAALSLRFVPLFGWERGLWEALFHAVSAFNNAGFSTFPDGLEGFATDPLINLVIPALFITGGIGFVVLQDLVLRRRWSRFSLHSKIMLAGTAVLIPWSVGMFVLLEWTNPHTLAAHDGPGARLWVSWFQGVTTRTAGFNTTDIGGMRDSTTLMFISLMLIGGGPTSTAGGIKVTTFVIMLVATVAFFRRQTQLSLFGRSIGLEQVFKVMALTAISAILVFTGVFLLSLNYAGDFLDIAFEVASAFGTVGLSRGHTDDLDAFGRAVIMAVMFLGRVGPLTLGFFIATQAAPRIRYPEGQVHLG